jgi:hypothetical protein
MRQASSPLTAAGPLPTYTGFPLKPLNKAPGKYLVLFIRDEKIKVKKILETVSLEIFIQKKPQSGISRLGLDVAKL